jgi:lysine/ornithine N-monooxygenase
MEEIKMKRYEFNIVVIGLGESADEAFNNVLNSLKEDPEAAIINEVVYAVVNDETQEEPDEALNGKLE